MGTALSTFGLLIGSLFVGIMSSVAANRIGSKNWSQAKIFTGVSMGTGITIVLLTLFILIKSHMGGGMVTSIVEEMAFGVMLSFIFLMMCMIGVTVLNGIALSGELSDKPENTRAYGMSIGAAVLSFGSFIVSLFIIIFLL